MNLQSRSASGSTCVWDAGRRTAAAAPGSRCSPTRLRRCWGALYLDGGLETVRRFLLPLVKSEQAVPEDYKTRLQEIIQQNPEGAAAVCCDQRVGTRSQQAVRRRGAPQFKRHRNGGRATARRPPSSRPRGRRCGCSGTAPRTSHCETAPACPSSSRTRAARTGAASVTRGPSRALSARPRRNRSPRSARRCCPRPARGRILRSPFSAAALPRSPAGR